ncbi:hypothetical protein GOP47_0003201 [Adiantum capillus-veneris]|uniref:Uncharacterized protein n=1 Tax=Adiantum capillus-veneris TaxID=13818 RepID=A0A9D4VC02_ADICA|nr:hypothetical protein GOP47_0003201 [Adiantum capillus-veneris]
MDFLQAEPEDPTVMQEAFHGVSLPHVPFLLTVVPDEEETVVPDEGNARVSAFGLKRYEEGCPKSLKPLGHLEAYAWDNRRPRNEIELVAQM